MRRNRVATATALAAMRRAVERVRFTLTTARDARWIREVKDVGIVHANRRRHRADTSVAGRALGVAVGGSVELRSRWRRTTAVRASVCARRGSARPLTGAFDARGIRVVRERRVAVTLGPRDRAVPIRRSG